VLWISTIARPCSNYTVVLPISQLFYAGILLYVLFSALRCRASARVNACTVTDLTQEISLRG